MTQAVPLQVMPSNIQLGHACDKLVKDVIYTQLVSTKVQLSTDSRHVEQAVRHMSQPEYVRVLLSLLGYDYQPIRAKALSLLVSHFEQRFDLIRTMKATQVIVFPEMAYASNLLAMDLNEVRRNFKWICAPSDSKRGSAFKTCGVILERLYSLCNRGAVVQLGPYQVEIDAARKQKFQELLANLGAFDILIRMCHVSLIPPSELPRNNLQEMFTEYDTDGSGEFDKDELQAVAQALLEKVGVQGSDIERQLAKIELQDGEVWTFEEFYWWYTGSFRDFSVPQLKNLINGTCQFFIKFCEDCPSNQQQLHRHIGFFQKLVVEHTGLHAVYPLISTIIRNQREFCVTFNTHWLRGEIKRQGRPFDVEMIRLLRALTSSNDREVANMILQIVEVEDASLWLCNTEDSITLRDDIILGKVQCTEEGVSLEVYVESLNLLLDCVAAVGCNSGVARVLTPYQCLIQSMLDHTMPKVSFKTQ